MAFLCITIEVIYQAQYDFDAMFFDFLDHEVEGLQYARHKKKLMRIAVIMHVSVY